ncbi:hypothetical protein [Ohtaekwangia sp.]|uniref:hypothetical protein n=1 Tax=Ohtaekwangia sp. TaxID=2066019 RepID=UPI002F95C9B9
MFRKILSSSFIVSAAFLLTMCGEADNPQAEMNQFVSIFDNNQFNAGFNPVDMLQTADGGYVVLAEEKVTDTTEIPNIYLLKADKYGNFVKELELGDTLINPVGKLSLINDKLYFFCMVSVVKANGKDARLASVDVNLDGFKTTNVSGITYPAAASLALSGNQFVLLSYNIDDKVSVISTVTTEGAVTASKSYTVGEGDNSEEPILNHFLRTGTQFPFDVGQLAGGIYYFNGFWNYTFSLVFTDLNPDNKEPVGYVNGYNDKGGFSALVPLSASKYAAARFNFGNNYFLPNLSLAATEKKNADQLGGLTLLELIDNTKVKILRATLNGKNVLIYGADTQTRQIGLYFYNEADGAFIGSRYLGFSNPFQIGSLIATEDGGVAVCGITYLAGRFPRICIFKLSKEEVASNVK